MDNGTKHLTETMTIRLSKNHRKGIDKLARESGVGVAEWIRVAIERALASRLRLKTTAVAGGSR